MIARSTRLLLFVVALLVAAVAAPVVVAAPSLPATANLNLDLNNAVLGSPVPGADPPNQLQEGCEFRSGYVPTINISAGGTISGGCNWTREPEPNLWPWRETWTGTYSGTVASNGQATFSHSSTHTMVDPPTGFTVTYSVTFQGVSQFHDDIGGAGTANFTFNRVCSPGTDICPPGANLSYSGTVPFFITYEPTGPVDAGIDHIEVVQVVQTTGNSIPLVAGKTAVARVFLYSPSQASVISLTLKARRNGNLLADSPTLLAGSATVAKSDFDREIEGDSVNFRLPMSWVTAGVTELEAVLVVSGPGDSNSANNTRLETVTFQARNPLKVGYFELCIDEVGEVSCSSPASGQAPPMLRSIYPVANDGVQYRQYRAPAIVVDSLELETYEAWEERLRRLSRAYVRNKLMAPSKMPDQLILWVPANPFFGGLASTRASGGSGNVSFVRWEAGSPLVSYENVVHEIAHNFGADHPATADSCGSLPAFPVPDWPYANARIQEPGWDMATDNVVPAETHDFLSYCFGEDAPRWTSPYTYLKLFNANGTPASFAPQPRLSTNFIIISGSAQADGSSGHFDNVEGLSATYDLFPSAPSGTHCLRFNNTPANDYCFSISFLSQDGVALSEGGFIHVLPEGLGPSEIKLCKAPCGPSDTLATMTRSANWPTVAISNLQPTDSLAGDAVTISWVGSDPDPGSNLTYSVFYSNDGANFMPIAMDITDSSVTFDTDDVGGGEFSYIKVTVSDGLNRSETSVGPVFLGTTRPWGDLLCNGALDIRDAIELRRALAGLEAGNAPRGCPVTGEQQPISAADHTGFINVRTWGDLDCTAGLTSGDGLSLLRAIAGLPVTPGAGNCPDVGEAVFVSN